ncbi:MAG TPA: hypothetical protein VJL81_11660 [Solirubrobacterales bacterium]|nr:hypothetical protein [Solirubrobacterales bacterium]
MSTERTERRGGAPGAFGLAIASDAGLPGLDEANGGGRRAKHRLVDPDAISEQLRAGGWRRIGADGQGASLVEYRERDSGDVLIRTRSFGDHAIVQRGRLVLSSVAETETEGWQSYVLGQVLPLTASVQGLEIFHAGAVAVAGGVIAIAGPSEAGKSSLAAALIASGAASFFTDDVLAVDAGAFGLAAYPGPTLIGVPHGQAATLPAELLVGDPWRVDGRKAVVRIRGERRPLPVRAFLRLTPDPTVRGTRFEACRPDRLMATTFDGVSRTPERLLRLLRVGALLAADGSALELRYRPDSDPETIAAAVLARLEQGPLAGRDAA